jgi:hypothetical protein
MDASKYDDAEIPLGAAYQFTRFIFNFNGLEAHLYHAFSCLIDDEDGEETEVYLSGVDSLAFKLDVVEGIAKTKAGNRIAQAIVKIMPKVRSLVSYRNTVAHSVLTFTPNGTVILAKNLFRTGRGAHGTQPFSEPSLYHSAELANAIAAELADACGGFKPLLLRRDSKGPPTALQYRLRQANPADPQDH